MQPKLPHQGSLRPAKRSQPTVHPRVPEHNGMSRSKLELWQIHVFLWISLKSGIVGYHIPQAPTLHLSELWTEKWYQKATQTKLSSFPSWTVWSSSWIKLNERNTPRWNASFQYRTYSLCFFGQNRRRGLTPEYRWSADHSDHSATNYSELLRTSLIVRCWHCHWLEFARMLPLRKWTACFPYSELESEWVACMASFNFGFSFSVVRDNLPSKMQVSTRCTSSTLFCRFNSQRLCTCPGYYDKPGSMKFNKMLSIVTYTYLFHDNLSCGFCLNMFEPSAVERKALLGWPGWPEANAQWFVLETRWIQCMS
jgi:hypothetical protein